MEIFKKAQSLTEYGVLIGIVVAALLAMQVYIKRGIQGRIKDLADQLSPVHYEAGNVEANYTITQQGTKVDKYVNGTLGIYYDGTEGSSPETITKKGYEITSPDVN